MFPVAVFAKNEGAILSLLLFLKRARERVAPCHSFCNERGSKLLKLFKKKRERRAMKS